MLLYHLDVFLSKIYLNVFNCALIIYFWVFIWHGALFFQCTICKYFLCICALTIHRLSVSFQKQEGFCKICLKGRILKREGEWGRKSTIRWLTPQVAVVSWTGLVLSQGSGASKCKKPSTRVIFRCFLSYISKKLDQDSVGILMTWWSCRQQLNILYTAPPARGTGLSFSWNVTHWIFLIQVLFFILF